MNTINLTNEERKVLIAILLNVQVGREKTDPDFGLMTVNRILNKLYHAIEY